MPKLTPRTVLHLVRRVRSETVRNAVEFNATVRRYNQKYGRTKPQGSFTPLGKVTGIDQQPRGAVIHAEKGHVEIYFESPEIVRVRMNRTAQFDPPLSYAVEKVNLPQPAVRFTDELENYTILTDQLICRVQKAPFKLVFLTPEGRVISEDRGGINWRDTEVSWTRHLPQQEWCYGLGMRAQSLNLRGKRLGLWNRDPMPYERGADPIYTCIPFYLGIQPEMAFGILWDNPARGYVDLGLTNASEMTFSAEDGELRFYLFWGTTAQAVLGHYTVLTGRMPLPPIWALGFQQSRWGYENEAVFRKLASEFRQRKLPCDVLYFDIDYMDGYRCFTWNQKCFPMLPNLLAELEQQGFKAVAIIDPGIKIDPAYSVYQDGIREDVFLKYPDGERVVGPVWPGKCHFPDFTNPRVRAWWGEQVKTLVQAGFAGFWNDMNEPAIIAGLKPGITLPDYVRHDWEGKGSSHVEGGHNVYGMQMARSTREGVVKYRPDKRPFVMTRAGHAGMQRYTSSWTGDNVSTWDHLRLSISMSLNMGLSGVSFTGPDIGGFAGQPDGELFTRWMQLGSMLPYFRVHSMAGTPPQEPWCYGDRYETIIRQALELRYQLLPYIYSAFAQCAQDGTPIIRPMFASDLSDSNLRELDDQFMLGDAILVAPVVEQGATQRTVYLPRGVWYEYDTGKLIDGAQSITANAPLERLPLYIRAGRVIPMWPVMQYVGEQPISEGHLRVYAGSGESSLYEDVGEGFGYQQGDHRWSTFTCKFLPSGQFAIEWRRAGKYKPPYEHVRVEVVGIPSEPESVALDGQSAPVWYFEAGIVEFIVKPFNEARVIGHSHTSSSAQKTLARPPKR